MRMNAASWLEDVRLAARRLRRARGFTGAAVFMLTLGIAGTTVMFALVEGILLRKLPVRDQDRLLLAWMRFPTGTFEHWPFRGAEIDRIGAESRLFEKVAGVGYNAASTDVAAETPTDQEISNTSVVTGAFFEVLGVSAVLGRTIEPADDVTGAENVLVLTHAAWQRRYGGAADVIGRRVEISGHPFRIVGVMPRDVTYPGGGIEGWMSVAACASTLTTPTFREAVRNELDLVGRLRPGVTLTQAKQELAGLIARIEESAPPRSPRGLLPVVRSYESQVVGSVRGSLYVLLGAVVLLLLISAVNVANLLLLRVESRRSEIAVRAALGAGRARLARELLAETVLLALGGGLLGLVVARSALGAVLALVPGGLPRADAVRVDPAVVLFTVGLVFAVSALAGVVPALASARMDLATEMKSGRRSLEGAGGRGRRLLVMAQAALAVTVVAVAGLLVRSLLRLDAIDTGLVSKRLVFVALTLPGERYADQDRHLSFLDEVVERLMATPGIDGATPVNAPPFGGAGWDAPTFRVEGQDFSGQAANPSLSFEAVHPGHFRALGVPIVAGREFTDADRGDRHLAIIVSEDIAARIAPHGDAVGQRIRLGGDASEEPWRTVVGVAKATRYRDLRDPRPAAYVPAPQFIVSAQSLVVRSSAPAGVVAGLVRDRVRAVDPLVKVTRVSSFEELRAGPLARPRFNAVLIGFFGTTALLLTGFGLHAVMAAYVRQRRAEIGIRLALGATAAKVRALVLRESLSLTGAGALIGVLGALAGSRLVRGLLYEVSPLDPASILGAAVVLVIAALVATWLPARRATRVDPATVLRAV